MFAVSIKNFITEKLELPKKKLASYLYRTATTKHPCCIPTLGDSLGAGRIRLARAAKLQFLFVCANFFQFPREILSAALVPII
jgi:hypothetical protein